jgi:predicted trehalose synthase
LEIALNLLNLWENKLMGKIFDKSLKLHFTLINYFTIERTLYELNYELLFRPNVTIIPILGLKEIIDKN